MELLRLGRLAFLYSLLLVSCGPKNSVELQTVVLLNQSLEQGVQRANRQSGETKRILGSRALNMGDDERALLIVGISEKVSEEAKLLNTELERLKRDLVEHSSSQSFDEGDVSYKANYLLENPENEQVVAETLFGTAGISGLAAQIDQTRKVFLHSFDKFWSGTDSAFKAQLQSEILLDIAPFKVETWYKDLLVGSNRATALSLLTKVQHDLALSEQYVQEQLFLQLGSSYLKVIDAMPVSRPNDFVMALGDTFQSKLYLSFHQIIGQSKIWVDDELISTEMGFAKFSTIPKEKGMHSHSFVIECANVKTGKVSEYESEIRYFVY